MFLLLQQAVASSQTYMNKEYLNRLYSLHIECPDCPSPETVGTFFKQVLGVLFPDHSLEKYHAIDALEAHLSKLENELVQLLIKTPENRALNKINPDQVGKIFFEQLPLIHEALIQDIAATFEGDPAARNKREIIRTYPGFYAIAAYRVAHALHTLQVSGIPRIITEFAHSKTGIDIHPGAQIGSHFCIDHGTGIVIGETSIIGNHVKIYQGVTLGALSVDKADASIKRHPTIEDHVIMYSGATILGGDTIIGHHSIIGGNVWLTQSVPAYSKIYYQAKVVHEGDQDTDRLKIKTYLP